MSLDDTLLVNRADTGNGFNYQCPVCAQEGHDLTDRNHLHVYPNGAYVCILHRGETKAAHNQLIYELVGLKGCHTRKRRPPKPRPPAPVIRLPILEIPPLEVPTDHELDLLAISRKWHCPLAHPALRELANRGLLWMAWWRDYGPTSRAWIVTDSYRYTWRARRLDGQLWFQDKKTTTKGKPQVAGWPVGVDTIGTRPNVVLCEGEADLLAAAIVAHAEGCNLDTIAFCAVLGAVKLDDLAVGAFRGKRVLVAAQHDATHGMGADMGEVWLQQLHQAGAGPLSVTNFATITVDGKPCKDFGVYATTLKGTVPPRFFGPFLTPPIPPQITDTPVTPPPTTPANGWPPDEILVIDEDDPTSIPRIEKIPTFTPAQMAFKDRHSLANDQVP